MREMKIYETFFEVTEFSEYQFKKYTYLRKNVHNTQNNVFGINRNFKIFRTFRSKSVQ